MEIGIVKGVEIISTPNPFRKYNQYADCVDIAARHLRPVEIEERAEFIRLAKDFLQRKSAT